MGFFSFISWVSFVILVVSLVSPKFLNKLLKRQFSRKKILLVFGGIWLLALLFAVAATPAEEADTETGSASQEAVTVNLCESDPENVDYWSSRSINLLAEPNSGAQKVAEIPACESVDLVIIDKQEIDGLLYLQVEHNEQRGWQTSRLLGL